MSPRPPSRDSPARRLAGRARRGRGAIAPIVSVLSVVLLGMHALAYDLGRVALVKSQLQAAADASALAGAYGLATDQLISPYSASRRAAADTAARAQALKFAQANATDFNNATSVVMSSASDIDVGLLSNPSDLTTAFAVAMTSPPNSVRVRTYADATHGGALKFAFAPVLGLTSSTPQATATATAILYAVESMQASSTGRSPILPITMSYSDYQQMIAGKSPLQDLYSVNPTTGAVTSGADGLAEQQLYPGSNVTSSNNGLLQFGTGSHSNSILSDQIANGPTSSQLKAEWPPNGAPPWNSSHRLTIGADPGWRAANFDDLSTVVTAGQPRLILLNDGTSPGNGAKGSYTIVAIAPVRVVYVDKGGKSSGYALVQPSLISDPSLIAGTTPIAPGTGVGGIPVLRLTR